MFSMYFFLPFRLSDSTGTEYVLNMLLRIIVTLNLDFFVNTYIANLDTIQDFLYKLGMKPYMDLVEISIFSLIHVIGRPTKIPKELCEASS